MDKGKEMKIYNLKHIIEKHSNYMLKNKSNDKELTNYIHDNYEKMSFEEMKNIVTKCMTQNDVKKILLEYDFYNYDCTIDKKTYMSLSQVKYAVEKILNRYQSKAGGFKIEDTVWSYHNNESYQYTIKNYKIMFENTINKIDILDIETKKYLTRLELIFNNLAENIKCMITTLKIDGYGLYCINIWLKDISISPNGDVDTDTEELLD